MSIYFEQVLPSPQHELFGQLQLSPQHDAQSLQQHASVFVVAVVLVAKNKPAVPSIRADTAIKMFFLIVVFLKVLKNGFVLYGLCIIYLRSSRAKAYANRKCRTHSSCRNQEIRLTTGRLGCLGRSVDPNR